MRSRISAAVGQGRRLAAMLRPSTPAARDNYRFDAFISYSRVDAVSVLWLHDVLARFWVPGFGHRNVFLDDRSLVPGPLAAGLRDALAQSAHLVLCWSSAAAQSTYVALEVKAFLDTHPPDRIVVCLVGPAEKMWPALPEWLLALDPSIVSDLFTPDLRGYEPQGQVSRDLHLASLAVLAAILGLPDKGMLLDRRKKTLTVTCTGLALVSSLAADWFAWTRTDRYQLGAIAAGTRLETSLSQPELVRPLEPLLTCLVAAGHSGMTRQLLATEVEPARSEIAARLAGDLGRRGRAAAAAGLLRAAIGRAGSIRSVDVRARALVALATRAADLLPADEAASLSAQAFTAIRKERRAVPKAELLSRLVPVFPSGLEAADVPDLVLSISSERDPAQARRAISAVGPWLLPRLSASEVQRLAAAATAGLDTTDAVVRPIGKAQAAAALARLGLADAARDTLRQAAADARHVPSLSASFMLSSVAGTASTMPGGVPDDLRPSLGAIVQGIEAPAIRALATARLAAAIAGADGAAAATLAAEAIALAAILAGDERVSITAEVAAAFRAAGLREAAEAAASALYDVLSIEGAESVTHPEPVAQAGLALARRTPDKAAAIIEAARREAVGSGDDRALAVVTAASVALLAARGEIREARLLASTVALRTDRLWAEASIACEMAESADLAIRQRPD